jgi:heptaprenyl diphosphate synthase
MIIAYKLPLNFSIIGVSIAGAVSHNIGQLLAVRLILIREDEIFYLTPLLIIMGMITGIITGYIAYLVVSRIKNGRR